MDVERKYRDIRRIRKEQLEELEVEIIEMEKEYREKRAKLLQKKYMTEMKIKIIDQKLTKMNLEIK